MSLQLAHLLFYKEKVEVLVQKNSRLIKKEEIILMDKHAFQLQDILRQQLGSTRSMAFKLEQKVHKIK